MERTHTHIRKKYIKKEKKVKKFCKNGEHSRYIVLDKQTKLNDMKVFTTREIVAILGFNGYEVIRQNGSHQIWRNAELNKQFPLPTGNGKHAINRMLWQKVVKRYSIICRF